MTREQMAEWLERYAMAPESTEPEKIDQIAAYLRQCCATCQHADTQNMKEGWAYCAPPAVHVLGPRFPFAYKPMPLDERCKGWTAKEGA